MSLLVLLIQKCSLTVTSGIWTVNVTVQSAMVHYCKDYYCALIWQHQKPCVWLKVALNHTSELVNLCRSVERLEAHRDNQRIFSYNALKWVKPDANEKRLDYGVKYHWLNFMTEEQRTKTHMACNWSECNILWFWWIKTFITWFCEALDSDLM